jgi:hypothetical protein
MSAAAPGWDPDFGGGMGASLHPGAPRPLSASDAYQRLLERPAAPTTGGSGGDPPRGRPGRVLLVDFRTGEVLGARS